MSSYSPRFVLFWLFVVGLFSLLPPRRPCFHFRRILTLYGAVPCLPCIDSSHYPDNTHSYTDETYYWEIVLTARKVGIVAISVFGRVIGTQRQAQVALLILFLCISIEIAARPYKIATERHKVLGRLELATLFSLWGTMWCGTLIFASQSPGDEGFVVFLSLLVACINIGILAWLIYRLIAECLFENKDTKAGRVVMRRMNSLRKQASWRRASGGQRCVAERPVERPGTVQRPE